GFVEHHDVAVLGLGRQRVLEAQRLHLLRQIELVAVHDRTHGLGAPDVERSGTRTVTGAAAALLRAGLLLRAVHFRAGQDLVIAAAALGELPNDHALDQILARLKTEDGVVEFDFTGRLVVEIEDFRLHGQPSAFCSAAAGAAAASRFFTEPGIGTL